METVLYIGLAWLINVSLNAIITDEPRAICQVEHIIEGKSTYVPTFCDELGG